MIINIFAPSAPGEFARVLKPGGVFLKVIPLEDHLLNLKREVYKTPYRNTVGSLEVPGFSLKERYDIKYDLHLSSSEDIENLFKMTPYYYKTSAEDQKKLTLLSSLTTEIQFGILVYINQED